MQNSSDIFKLVLQYITKESIKKSNFLDDVSDNRLRNIIKNNIDVTMNETEVTKFKKTNDLGMVINHLLTKDLSNFDFNNYVQDNDSSPVTTVLNSTTDAFKNNLQLAKLELSNLHNSVTDLLNKYDIIFNKHMSPNNNKSYLNTILNYEEWRDVSMLGDETTIIEEVNKVNKLEDATTVSLSILDNYVNKLKLMHQEHSKDIKQLVLDEGKKDVISAAIASTSGLSLRDTKLMFDTIISRNGVNYYISLIERMNNGTTINYFNDITETLLKLNKFLRGYNKVIVAQDNKDTYLDNNTVKYNVSQLQNVTKGLIYAKCFYRYNLWQKLLILPNGKINKDLMERAEKNNISKNTLRLFVHRTDFTKGMSYFTIDNVVNSLDHYKKQQTNDDNQVTYNNQLNSNKTKLLAFTTVMNDFCRTHKINGKSDFIQAVGKEITDLNKPTEYGFYKVLFAVNNHSVITKDLYDEFSKAFAERLTQNDEITKRTIQETQAVVLTKYINKFVIENFC